MMTMWLTKIILVFCLIYLYAEAGYIDKFKDLSQQEEKIVYYESLINKKNIASLVHKLDQNADRYKPYKSNTVEDFGTFDFIICGAGAAGPVLAKRLSEVLEWKVLLLEAGGLPDESTYMPALAVPNMASDFNWGFFSVPQNESCQGYQENRCGLGRGRGLGGGTLINGAVIARSNPKDLDTLNEIVSGWSYNDMLPYLMKFENFTKNRDDAPVNPNYHKTGGEVSTQFNSINNSRTQAFYKGCQELGYNYTDYNSPKQVGCSPIQFYINKGRRMDAGSAFVLPIIDRPNFKLMTHSFVTKVKIDNISKNATGVYFTHENKLYFAKANKEVILSAGAFQSPQLLMLSGVGPKDHLEELGINVYSDLAVGKNLRDHHSLAFVAQHNQTDDGFKSQREDIKDYINGYGRLTTNQGIASVSWFPTSLQEDKTHPDIELIFMPYISTSVLINNNIRYTLPSLIEMALGIDLRSPVMLGAFLNLQTKSVGSVRLKSSSPYDYPLIDPNLFSNEEDLERLYQGYLGVQAHFDTPAMNAINARITKPKIPKCAKFDDKSRDYWYCIFRLLAFPAYHPIGTCAMGTDPKNGAVVDAELKVYNVNNLRVCDASIFPLPQSHNPVINLMAFADKLSDIIKKSYNKI